MRLFIDQFSKLRLKVGKEFFFDGHAFKGFELIQGINKNFPQLPGSGMYTRIDDQVNGI